MKTWWTLLPCALVLWACGGGKQTDPNVSGGGSPCVQDRDCAGGLTCEAGLCARHSACSSSPLADAMYTAGFGNCEGDAVSLAQGSLSGTLTVDAQDGAIRLTKTEEKKTHIWIVNTGQATVSKIDTESLQEVGRYRTGPWGARQNQFNAGDDPSRTSINSVGDAFVGNRLTQSLTKIHGAGCPDADGDGEVTTSHGNTALDWKQDECVAWYRVFAGGGQVRGVAAQDVVDSSGSVQSYVWVASYGGDSTGQYARIRKLNGSTGDVLVETDSPVDGAYGLALDGHGNLWIASNVSASLGRIDTTRCTDNLSCDVQACVSTGLADNGNGDECIKQSVFLPGYAGTQMPYGITVDSKQRVWLAGGFVTRYDPSEASASRIEQFTFPWAATQIAVHGISASADGWIWGASLDSGVVRIHADNPTASGGPTVVAGTTTHKNKGVAVDVQGKVWSIPLQQDFDTATPDVALVIDPGTGPGDETVDATSVDFLYEPYTYSDMTGTQLRNVLPNYGTLRTILQGCDDGATQWSNLVWNGEVPVGTQLIFQVRTGATRSSLAAAQWVNLGSATSATSLLSAVDRALEEADLQPRRYLEVEVQLQRLDIHASSFLTPTLRWLEASYSCDQDIL